MGDAQTKCQAYGYKEGYSQNYQCQFEGLYSNVREKHYSDFYDDFYEISEKHYCTLHAPMEAKKISGKYQGMTKKSVFECIISKSLEEELKPYHKKFHNLIYGVINQQI